MSPIFDPIKSLLSRTPLGVKAAPIAVVPMTAELVDKWHEFVQPLIDSNYVHWGPSTNSALVRTDKQWNWHNNFTLLALHNTLYAGGSKIHGEGLAMCIVLRSPDESEEFPIGMLTAVPKLHTNVVGQRRQRPSLGIYLMLQKKFIARSWESLPFRASPRRFWTARSKRL